MRSPCSVARAAEGRIGWPHLPVCLICAASFSLQADPGTPTNQAALSYATPPSASLEGGQQVEGLIGRLSDEILSSDSTVFDRFTGPASQLSWARTENRLGYDSLERLNSKGANMFGSIGMDSLRTATVEALGLDAWQDRWEGWVGTLISGSIGNPQEQRVELASASYSAVRSSWENRSKDAGFQWGIRPWRTNPYLYFLTPIGHFENRPLVTLEGRTGYTLFGSARAEGRVTFQLPYSFRLAGGAGFDPSRMGTEEHGAAHFALTLERALRLPGLNPDAVFFIGFRSGLNDNFSRDRQRENLLLAGFTKRW